MNTARAGQLHVELAASMPPGYVTCMPPGNTTCIPLGNATCIPPGNMTCIPLGNAMCMPEGLLHYSVGHRPTFSHAGWFA